MARPIRIEFGGALYHVTSRGDGREAIFQDDADRHAFLDVLAHAVDRFKWICHAYCLMGNHYHLFIETPEPNLSAGMRHVNGVYTQRFNRAHGRTGHVFQGRFKAVVVEKESHFLEVCRYVVLNPVRAGMLTRAQQWPWSSYRATAGLRTAPAFLTIDEVLLHFASRRGDAQAQYRAWVREGVAAQSPFDGVVGSLVLGSEAFVSRCRELIDGRALHEAPRSQRHLGRPSLAQLFDAIDPTDKAARNPAIVTAYHDCGYTMKAIADRLGLNYSTVSVVLKRQDT